MSDLRTELENIKTKYGRLTPKLVLEEARDPSHPLHARFEWSDAIAAERYRLDQARELLSLVKIQYVSATGETKMVRQFHAIRASDDDEFTYEDAADIARDPFMRKLLLREMTRDIAELVARYEGLQEFWQELRKLRRKAS